MASIEDYTFNDCYSLNNLTIPNSVKRIGKDALPYHLDSLTIPHCIYITPFDSYWKISNVKNVNINITDWSLDNTAISRPAELINTSVKYFYDGVELSDVIIPDTISTIGNNLLAKASNITSIHIPSHVQRIGDHAFAYCDNLGTVTFETNSLAIGRYALYECPNLSSINVNITDWSADTFGNIEFKSDCIYYSNRRKLSDVVVPDSVTTIGQSLFVKGQNITSVTMHDNVNSIGEGAFRDCKNLTSATISNSVTSISDYAFSGTGLTSIDLPNSVTKIGRYAFKKCPELKTIKMPNSVTNIGSEAFYDCSSLSSIDIPNSVTEIGSEAFSGCSNLSSIDIPNSVTKIGTWAFLNCSKLATLSFASQSTKAEIEAFECPNLSSIIVNITDWSRANNIDSDICIDYYTNGEKMVDVVIPDSVTSIGYYSLFGGKEINSITLPKSITSIGRGAFGQLSLSSVQVSWPEPMDIKKDNVFYESDLSSCTLYVPKGTKSLYSEADIWKDFVTIEEVENGEEPENKQCAAPTISFEDGKIMLSCETEGVEFVSVLTENCAKEYNTDIISLTPTYTISVYATKTGYTNSEVVTKEIPLSFDCIEGDMNNDGKVSVADVSKLVSKILQQAK